MKVPFFNYPHLFQSDQARLLQVMANCANRGAFIGQADLEEFEMRLAAFVGTKYALGVGNATDGLMLACKAAGIGPGDEVILASHTMIATAIGVHFAGGTPVPVDCGADHLIDAGAVERAVTPRTKAILPTQLNGRTADMDALQTIADRHGLLILEDAAQALGSKYRGRCAGSFGLASAISFYPAKTLGCFGDGGAVLTSDHSIYERLRELREFGRNQNGEIVSWGLNTRLDNLQAAILNHKLNAYGSAVDRRRELAALYHSLLEECGELTLPPPPDDGQHFDVFQNYEIEAERRDELIEYLAFEGVGTMVQWGGVALHQLCKLGFTQQLPRTDRLFERLLLLPLNPSLTDDDVRYVCGKIHGFYRAKLGKTAAA